MRVYVAVASRGPGRGLVERARLAARRSLPFSIERAVEETWTSADGRIALLGWSNEPTQIEHPLLRRQPTSASESGAVLGVSGYTIGEPFDVAGLLGGTPPLCRQGGVWSAIGADDTGILGLTCASGAESVFHAESSDVLVVGNRALLVHLVADPSGPHVDPLGLASIVSTGYAVTDRTAFEAVRAVPPATTVRAVPSGRAQLSALAYAEEPLQVAEALRASVRPLRAGGDRVQLGLTGGRDSRLLVALLHAAGVTVTTRTSGLADDPDVVVATEVAAALGVPHRVTPPMGAAMHADAVTIDVVGRLKEAVVLADGMLTAYDRVGRIDDVYRPAMNPFGGSGGEILRGYYAGAVKDPDDAAAVLAYMRGRLFGSAARLTRELRVAFEADCEPWLAAAGRDGVVALEDFYVRQRTGRWTAAARGSASIGSMAQRPYLDHEVVRAVRAVPLRSRVSENLIADLLDDLAPQLRDVRFAGRRWKFDQRPPSDPLARAAWQARAPVVGEHGDQASFNWRLDLPAVRDELTQVVLDAPEAFWQIADRRRVEELLLARRPLKRQEVMRAWHLATVAAALDAGFWTDPTHRLASAARELTATVPSAGAPTAPRAGERLRGLAQRVRDRARR